MESFNKLKTAFQDGFGAIWKSVLVSVLSVLCIIGLFVVINDSGKSAALRWLLAIFLIAFIMRPFLAVKNIPLWDNGFALSYGLGFALSFFAAWILAACKLVPYGSGICVASLLAFLVISIIGRLRKKIEYTWKATDINRFIRGFVIFALVFLCAFWVIGFNPVVDAGTENYMDYGFMTSIFRQKTVAPMDIWCAGEQLNYYYLGQAAAVYMCRVAGTTPEYGYNLMLCTFWAMTFTASSEIVYGMIGKIITTGDFSKRAALVSTFGASAMAGGLAAFAANGHWLICGVLKQTIDYLGHRTQEFDTYWFPDATVYISTAAGDIDNGKNEFPAYSAILGDLHAHVCNLIFVLPLIAILIDYSFAEDEKKTNGHILLAGILLALFKGVNYWDFAIYFVITGAVVVFCDIRRDGFKWKTIGKIGIKALIILALSYILIYPFTGNFNKIASSIEIATTHTNPLKLIVLWGIPFVVTVILIMWMLFAKEKKIGFPAQSGAGFLAIALCTMGLVISPELIYVLDIYGGDNLRFNTMFKFTYEAFVLFALIMGFAFGLLILRAFEKGKLTLISVVLCAFIGVMLMAYTPASVKDWYGDVFDAKMRKGISSINSLYMNEEYSIDMRAYDELMQDKKEIVNIVEAAGDSYTHQSVLSVLSGTCTVAGWYVHEWLWHGDTYDIECRTNDVRRFFEEGDPEFCSDFLKKYNVDYIYSGPTEQSKYYVNPAGFEQFAEPVMMYDKFGWQYRLYKVDRSLLE